MSKSITLDAEVEAEEEAVKNLSDKYLKRETSDGKVIDDDDYGELQNQQQNATMNISSVLNADILELSDSISVKEALIHQLQSTQDKFETMREFYEQKLREMEGIVAVKEKESEKLSDELKELGADHRRGKELTERLKEKKQQVAELKRKQSELSRLTNVASRNETQIARLRNDVNEMKNKKVDLQKQIKTERKNHMIEVRKMKKESIQKDRELNKTKREVYKKSEEATKAHKIAKVRLEQMNQLRVKYKDTAKHLRMQTVKKGVLKKAGLDPVIFGRRRSSSKNGSKNILKCLKREADVDKLRHFFDKKVAEVSRRENLAEKLAQEWEEHLELTIKKEESLQGPTEGRDESLRALESAIKYRQERIRQLASKLGKREKLNKENRSTDEALIFNKEFNEIVGTKALDEEAEIVAKVLFGMVVRERRRIASLARTASSLDEKVQETQTALAENEAAFSAYVGEQRLDAAALAQNQQQQILSLMELVKEGHAEEASKSLSSSEGSKRRRLSSSVADGNARLLILANERIDVLERELSEKQLVRETLERYQEREQSATSLLEEKTIECEELNEEIDDLRSALRCIREEVALDESGSSPRINKKRQSPSEAVLDIVTNALRSASTADKPKRRRSSMKARKGQSLPLSSLSIEDGYHSSDSEEVPDWAEDIMADLAIIADGKIPSILLESQEVLEAEAQLSKNVFDRLANPKNFTGVQKQRNAQKSRPVRKIDTSETMDEKEKKNEKETKRTREKIAKFADTEKRSVFDRLLSPSNLTGTQKQRFNSIQDKKDRTLDNAIENQFVSVRGRSRNVNYDSIEIHENGRVSMRDEIKTSKSDINEKRNESQNSIKTDSYSGLDVFERLNRTRTIANREKVNSNIAEKMLDEILSDEEVCAGSPKFEPRLARVREYESQDVFERLQKTTTEAYARKKIISEDDADIQNSPIRRYPLRSTTFDAPGLNLSSAKKGQP